MNIQKAIREQYSDGTVIISNLRNKRGIPFFKLNDSYTATRVSNWYDGTPMTDEKVDGKVYLKHIYNGNVEYYLVNLPNWGESFLEKDTIEDFRSMSSTELLLIKSGYYKGVKLNGYDYKGSTPASIEYYLSETELNDDGGSVIVINGTKFKHEFNDYIHVSYFGAVGDGVFNNTDIFNKIIECAKDNWIIEFMSNSVYVGHFVSNKPLVLKGNNSTLTNYNSSNIMEFTGDVTLSKTTAVTVINYSDVLINVNSVEGIEVNDLITIYDNTGRPQDSSKVNYETLKVKSIDAENNIIEVYDMVRSSQQNLPITIDLIKPLVGVRVSDFVFKSNGTHQGAQLMNVGCEDIKVENITTYNNVGNAVSFRRCNNFTLNKTIHYKPRLNGGGQGYGTAVNWSRNGYIKNVTGYEMRHVVDYTGAYCVDLDTVFDYNSFSPIQLCHNTFGGKLSAKNIYVDGQNYAALHIQGQGLSNPNAHLFRDLYIENVTQVVRANNAGNLKTIRIECSVSNVVIKNINLVNNIEGYLTNKIEDNIVSISSGSITGNVVIENIRANKIGYPVFHSRGTEVQPNNGMLTVDGVYVYSCYRIALLLGTKRFSIRNVEAIGSMSDGASMLDISSGAFLTECYIGDNVRLNTYIPFFNVEPENLLIGSSKKLGLGDETPLIAYTTSIITRKNIDCRNIIKFTHSPTANITLVYPNFIPDPLFKGEEFYIMLNNPEDFGVKGSMIIPNTNTNIINPDGGFGLTIRSGDLIKLKGFFINEKKVWIAERMNKQASNNVKGTVNQSAKVDNITTNDATDLASVLLLANELKAKLNSKLNADRTSGQQSST